MIKALANLNFRDLGGLPTRDGRGLRHGLIYRSEGPVRLLPEHRQELRSLDIKLICDLRAEIERAAAPNDWNATGRLLNFDVVNDLRVSTHEAWRALRDDASETAAKIAMRSNYTAIPFALQPQLADLIGAVIDGEAPVLIHCTAGKDRTGVLIALLLALLGVGRDEIDADYLRSDVFATNLDLCSSIAESFKMMFGFSPSAVAIRTMLGVDSEYLDAAFEAVARDFGSVDAYFTSAGLDKDQLEQFRSAMLQKHRLESVRF